MFGKCYNKCLKQKYERNEITEEHSPREEAQRVALGCKKEFCPLKQEKNQQRPCEKTVLRGRGEK